MGLRYTTPGTSEANDMQVTVVSHLDLTPFPSLVASLGTEVAINLVASLQFSRSRGRITLASTDPHEQPVLAMNYLSDPEDLFRLREGVRLAWRLAHSPALAPYVEGVLRIDEATVASDEALELFIRKTVTTSQHISGSARMGPPDDPMAVVDQHCRVRGIDGLRVVDASIMPDIPRANTNLTTIVIGERAAEWMRQEE